MSIKKRDTPEAKEFWDFVEKTAAEVRRERETGVSTCCRHMLDAALAEIRAQVEQMSTAGYMAVEIKTQVLALFDARKETL